MAGITIPARDLDRTRDGASPIVSMAHAAIVAAGPWLYTVLAILLVGGIAEPLAGENAVTAFRVQVMYSFCLSLIGSAPFIIVAVRGFSDDLFSRRADHVPSIYLGASAAACVCTTVIAASALLLLIGADLYVVASGTVSAGVLSLCWVGVAFTGVLRDHRQLTIAFSAGLIVGALLAIGAARAALGPCGMVVGFALGFFLIFAWATARILATFTTSDPARGGPVLVLFRLLRQHRHLAIAGFMAAAGIWADKWVLWGGSYAQVTVTGLPYVPQYEAAMFAAALTLLPSLALMVASLETNFFEAYRYYLGAIEGHATLQRLEQLASSLEKRTIRAVGNILSVQGAICATVVVIAPAIIERAGMNFAHLTTLRAVVIAGLCQVCFVACSSIVLFFDRAGFYAALQTVFVVLVSVCTWLATFAGERFLGAGYLTAALVSAALALVAVACTFRDANIIVFIASANRQQA